MFLTNCYCRVPCFRLVFEAAFGEIVHVSRSLWKRDAPSELESSCLILRLCSKYYVRNPKRRALHAPDVSLWLTRPLISIWAAEWQ
jgi:hypothetical protein